MYVCMYVCMYKYIYYISHNFGRSNIYNIILIYVFPYLAKFKKEISGACSI